MTKIRHRKSCSGSTSQNLPTSFAVQQFAKPDTAGKSYSQTAEHILLEVNMAPANAVHTRSHSLLLLQKLLNLRDGASPLTLLLDSLEQPAKPVVSEFITRAKLSKAKVIFLSFATIKKPRDVDVVVKATGKDLQSIRKELLSHYPTVDPNSAAARDRTIPRAVVIIDSLNTLASSIPQALATFLSGIITPAVSIVAVYHTDMLLLRSDHPVFAAPDAGGDGGDGEEEPESTFNLGLTEKQRKDREGIVLPYFDAQTEVGGGDGGRILYEMGREDDFDEEEDEI
ncbi:hypothetical protein PWT90_05270 [Aphanocladium album]|nr:hypothetical protein PWT90_05270 [Aphanocladium album]